MRYYRKTLATHILEVNQGLFVFIPRYTSNTLIKYQYGKYMSIYIYWFCNGIKSYAPAWRFSRFTKSYYIEELCAGNGAEYRNGEIIFAYFALSFPWSDFSGYADKDKGLFMVAKFHPFLFIPLCRVLYLKEAWYRFSTRLNSRLSELLAQIKLLPIKKKV